MKTPFKTREEAIAERKWVLIDAQGKSLGRLASQVASNLRGKNNPHYLPHEDTGDFVVVVNADKVTMTGKKAANEFYYRHTGFVGGIKRRNKGDVLSSDPAWVIWHAVKGMLPRTSLGRKQLLKLKVYLGTEHPHTAQRPQAIS